MNWMKLFTWILGVFILYLIIELIRKISGGSLGFEELVIGLLIANLGYSFTLHSKISALHAKFSEHLGWHRGKENETSSSSQTEKR